MGRMIHRRITSDHILKLYNRLQIDAIQLRKKHPLNFNFKSALFLSSMKN